MKSDSTSDVLENAETASKMLFRANVYFEVWWQSAGVDGRRAFGEFWDEYWEFWRFNEHAMQFAFIVYSAGLYENRSNTVNFGSLWKEARDRANKTQQELFDETWLQVQPTAKSVIILRSNAMAHRSVSLSYKEAFAKANVTPDQLRDLLFKSWKLLNIIEEAIGKELSSFEPSAIENLRRLAKLETDRIASEMT